MDLGMRPCESSRNAEGGERCGEERGEGGGDGTGRGEEGSRVEGGEGAEDGSWGKAGQAFSECCTVFRNGIFDRGNGEHVMKGVDWGSVKGAADVMNHNILGHLKNLDV